MKQTSVQGLVLMTGLVGYLVFIGTQQIILTPDQVKQVIKSGVLK